MFLISRPWTLHDVLPALRVLTVCSSVSRCACFCAMCHTAFIFVRADLIFLFDFFRLGTFWMIFWADLGKGKALDLDKIEFCL